MDRGITTATIATVGKVCSDIAVKCLGAYLYVIYAFSFDTAQGVGLKSLLVLIIADFVTGVAASWQTGEEIKSAKIFRTVIKLIIYFSFIALGHMVEQSVPLLSGFIDETILAFLAITELISNIENFGKLGYGIPKRMLKKLKDLRDEQ